MKASTIFAILDTQTGRWWKRGVKCAWITSSAASNAFSFGGGEKLRESSRFKLIEIRADAYGGQQPIQPR